MQMLFLCVIPGRRIEKHDLKTVSRGKEATEMFQHPSIKARIGVLVSALMLACGMAIAAEPDEGVQVLKFDRPANVEIGRAHV